MRSLVYWGCQGGSAFILGYVEYDIIYEKLQHSTVPTTIQVMHLGNLRVSFGISFPQNTLLILHYGNIISTVSNVYNVQYVTTYVIKPYIIISGECIRQGFGIMF